MSHKLSVIIPSYRNPSYLELCLDSLERSLTTFQREEVQVIVVLDGFVEESAEVMNAHPNFQFLELDVNQGMATAINLGVYNADGDLILVVNDDNVFPHGW